MKRNSDKWFRFSRNAVLLVLLIISFSNCKEKIEGCLDIEATNFSFSADEPCPDDCCTYPVLTFEVAFRWGDDPLIYDEPVPVSSGSVIKITKTKFYISDIAFTNGAERLHVTDRIDLEVNDGSQSTVSFVDDFTLLSRDFTSFNYEIGELRGAGTFDTLRFSVGLNEEANKVEPSLVPEGHPLAIESDSLWSEENQYIFNRLILIAEWIQEEKRKQYDVYNDPNKVDIAIPINLNLEVGNSLTVPIIVDYQKWLQGIDFEANDSVVIDKIVENTANAFSVNQ